MTICQEDFHPGEDRECFEVVQDLVLTAEAVSEVPTSVDASMDQVLEDSEDLHVPGSAGVHRQDRPWAVQCLPQAQVGLELEGLVDPLEVRLALSEVVSGLVDLLGFRHRPLYYDLLDLLG